MAALAAIGIGFQLVGAFQSADAAGKAAKHARLIGRLNEEGFRRLAHDRAERGRTEERDHYWKAAKFKGRQFTRITGAGLNADFGSAAQVQAETAMLIVRDASIIAENSKRDQEELLHRARIARAGGDTQAAGLNAQGISALYAGFGSALQGASQIVGSYY